MKNSPLKHMPAGVWMLGAVSMLMDISSEMIHSLLPLFLVTSLGVTALSVGLIEGVAEATAMIVKVFSGAISDFIGRRKAIVVFGYTIAAVTKPLFALATSAGMVFGARFLDRIGKGVRGAPRDALLADIAPAEIRGAAFGLRQSLDTIGAFVGPLLATGLMLLWANDFRAVFWVAVIPAVLSVFLIIFGVHEPAPAVAHKPENPISRATLRRLSRSYWWVVIIGMLFALARFSEAFLLLRAKDGGVSYALIPMVLVVMNVIYALAAYPLGRLSDSMSHTKLLAIGIVFLIAADLALAIDDNWLMIFVGVSLWGVHLAATQGLLARMVADTSPSDLRGTAYGFFNLMSGLAMFVASALAGVLWDQFGAAFTFLTGIMFCALALGGLFLRRNIGNKAGPISR
jgi:MFS family permease